MKRIIVFLPGEMMAGKEGKKMVAEDILTLPNGLFLNSSAASWLKMDIGEGSLLAGLTRFPPLLWALLKRVIQREDKHTSD